MKKKVAIDYKVDYKEIKTKSDSIDIDDDRYDIPTFLRNRRIDKIAYPEQWGLVSIALRRKRKITLRVRRSHDYNHYLFTRVLSRIFVFHCW